MQNYIRTWLMCKHDSTKTSFYMKYIIVSVHNHVFYMCICIFPGACGPCSPEELLHTVPIKVIYCHGWLMSLFD